MNIKQKLPTIFLSLGALLSVISFVLYFYYDDIEFYFAKHGEVHVHTDFSFYVLGEKINLTDTKYQSGVGDIKHADIHLHDNLDTVIHRHADGITFGDFMSSIGFTITDSCLTMDTGIQHCTNDENALKLYVNGKPESDIVNYVTNEEDRILLYYGNPQSPDIAKYQDEITEDACMYTGTCPEKGTPPSESCGLTCEI